MTRSILPRSSDIPFYSESYNSKKKKNGIKISWVQASTLEAGIVRLGLYLA